jgi:C4-dicarboxylate-specific signal transduction histidine kinase
MLDQAEEGEDSVASTVREASGQLARSLELLDRLLRLPPARPEPIPVSLSDPLRFVTEVYRVHRTGVALDAGPALRATLPAVRGVEQELEQILFNLVVNALDALGDSPDGRMVLSARVDRAVVELVVEDDGPGIASELALRLFQPGATSGGGATGGSRLALGLAASRLLAERHGGALAWEPGPGARFVLRLPVWRGASGSHPAAGGVSA